MLLQISKYQVLEAKNAKALFPVAVSAPEPHPKGK